VADVVSQKISDMPFLGKRLLVVKANDSESDVLETLLSQWGCDVTREANLPDIIDDVYDAIIIDHRYSSSLSAAWFTAQHRTMPMVVYVEGDRSVWGDIALLDGVYILKVSAQPIKLKTILQHALIG
jgi:hypothetical protein